MFITKLKINNFGKFHNREIIFKPGINLIYGENEAGKTTVHTFIGGMLFGIERARGRGAATKDDIYTKYLPWDYPGAYRGQMDIVIDGKQYRLQRSFHSNDKSFTILELETGREVRLKEGLIGELVPGLTESVYRNTVSIEQLRVRTDAELASQVRNYITNLSVARSREVNVAKAAASLTERKKALEAAQNNSGLLTLQEEIAEGVLREERQEALIVRLRELLVKEQELKTGLASAAANPDRETTSRMEQLPAILEKYRSYQELNSQGASLDNRMEELKHKMNAWEREAGPGDLGEELRENARNRAGARLMFCTSITVLISLLSLFPVPSAVRIAVYAGALLTGGLVYHILSRRASGHREARKERIRKLEKDLKTSYALEHVKNELAELYHRKTDLEDRGDMLLESIMTYMQYFTPEEELNASSMERLQEIIRLKKQEYNGRQMELTNRLNECKLQIEKLRWEIGVLEGNEEQLLRNREQYARLEQKQKENALELEAVRLALNTIQSLSTDIHDTFGRQLNDAVSEIIGDMTGHRYQDLKVDERLEIKVGWNGEYVPADRLSAGTLEQVYLALRLAVSRLFLGGEELPLLLDDSFALYDDNRMKAAIRRLSGRGQLLLFTCHRREQQILKELGVPYHSVEL